MLHDLLTSATGDFALHRPGTENQQALRAWDAADEYLIHTIHQDYASIPLSIFNDQFGALAVALNQTNAQWISDSYCSHQARNLNLTLNDLNTHAQSPSILDPWTNNLDLGIIKLPRNMSFLDYLLERCYDHGMKTLLIAGMMKHLPKNILPHLQKYGAVQRLPFKKKATIYKLTLDNRIDSHYPKLHSFCNIKLKTYANVFGRDKLDPGAAFFIEHMDKIPSANQVADLCCGSGILGLSYKNRHPQSQIAFYDESQMAICSSYESWMLNEQSDSKSCIWDDGLQQADSASFDLILCNPPFHEQNTIGDHISKRLFADAKRCLKADGKLIIIGNRHLGYHITLKKYFTHIQQLAANSKFILLEAHD